MSHGTCDLPFSASRCPSVGRFGIDTKRDCFGNAPRRSQAARRSSHPHLCVPAKTKRTSCPWIHRLWPARHRPNHHRARPTANTRLVRSTSSVATACSWIAPQYWTSARRVPRLVRALRLDTTSNPEPAACGVNRIRQSCLRTPEHGCRDAIVLPAKARSFQDQHPSGRDPPGNHGGKYARRPVR